jgi:hypothetical protein
MNTNITKTWTITIDEEEIFSRCTNESLYQAYNRTKENPKGDALVIQEDDMEQFHVYFSSALANLRMILARRMDSTPIDPSLGISITLQMHDNHDDNIFPILVNHCYEYLVKNVLEQWYRVDFGSELERLEINHCLHYRKHPVRRRIGPLF